MVGSYPKAGHDADAFRELAMYWIGVLFATIGASLILGALTFVSALIGVVVNAMIVLMAGPLVDRMLARRRGGSRA